MVISGFRTLRQARVPVADLRANSLATVPPTPRFTIDPVGAQHKRCQSSTWEEKETVLTNQRPGVPVMHLREIQVTVTNRTRPGLQSRHTSLYYS
ncbi:hypothetical protein PoB_007449000 [Plakobranchus ocellatus]|uniref:Uncharacterized protein n=1 Tax=Plakobranchus ocellatus TaxID=259542 RepID=A0AAV4DVA6_9GAST|nr:hypothetical protein PoB_007449000 [Plakobranchus ocellatus]